MSLLIATSAVPDDGRRPTDVGSPPDEAGRGPKYYGMVRAYRVDFEVVMAHGSIVVWDRGLDPDGACRAAAEALNAMSPDGQTAYLICETALQRLAVPTRASYLLDEHRPPGVPRTDHVEPPKSMGGNIPGGAK